MHVYVCVCFERVWYSVGVSVCACAGGGENIYEPSSTLVQSGSVSTPDVTHNTMQANGTC